MKHPTEQTLREQLSRDPGNARTIKTLGDLYLERQDYAAANAQYHLVLRNQERTLIPEILSGFQARLLKHPQSLSLRFYLAQFWAAWGDFNEAADEFEGILELDPGHMESTLELARMHLHQQDFPAVIMVLERARAKDEQNPVLTEMLAGAYLESGRQPDALRLYEALHAQQPDNLKVIKTLASLYRAKKDFEKAAESIWKLATCDPHSIEDAQRFLVNLLDQAPDHPRLLEIQGEIFLKACHPDRAVEVFRHLLRVAPESAELLPEKYKKLFDAFPSYPDALFALAELHVSQARYTEAALLCGQLGESQEGWLDEVMGMLRGVVATAPEQILARQILAECLLKKREYPEAIHVLRELLERSTEDAEVVIQKSRSMLNTLSVEETTERTSLKADAALLLAEGYFVQQECSKARSELERVFHLVPDYPAGLVLQAKMEFAERQTRKGLKTLQKAMAGFPGSKLLCETYRDAWHFALRHEIELLEATLARRDHLETRFQLAKRYQSLGMLDKAIAQYQHTVKDARYGAQAYLELLHCFKEKGQFEQALRQFQKALPLKNIEKEVFLTEAGLCAEALGEQSKAAEMYQAILEENIEKADIQSRVKQLNSNSWIDLRGKTLLAVEHQQRWILLWWKNPETHLLKTGKKRSALTELSFAQSHNNQGVEYAQRERIKAAEDEFTLALQLDPQFTTARNNLGVLYLQEGRLSEARAEFSAVLALNPDFYVARVHLALIAFKEGQWEWAQSAFRTALAQDPGLAEVALNLGDLHYATGECGEAVALWTAMAGPSILHEAAERRLKEIGVR